ncbi:MAG: AEC family transporter [Oscillospiraceae bacterium]
MQAAGVVANQVLIMFLLMGVGILTEKLRMIRYAAASQINNFLLLIVMPCVILNAYQIEFKVELLEGLLLAFLLALFSHAIGIVVSMLLARRKPDAKYRIERFAMVYSNCSFMAIPLLQAVVGSEGVFYGSAYIAVFNLFMWTHGIFLMSGERSMKAVRKALLNPGVISVAAGLILFFTPFRFPYVVGQVTGYIASLNTPLAMLLTGIFISRSGIKSAFSDKKVYFISAVRLLLIPLLVLGVIWVLPAPGIVRTACIISAACPCAASCSMFALRYKQDVSYSSKMITVSTLLSVLTLPVMILLAGMV